jgi:ABC-type amino acid transport substrate-binding protein
MIKRDVLNLVVVLLASFLLEPGFASAQQESESGSSLRAAFRSYPPSLSLCCDALTGPRGVEGGLKGRWITEDEIGYVLFGPWRDIISEVATRLDYSLVWQAQNFGESIAALESGDLDILPRVFWSEEREKIAWFVGPIELHELKVYFLVDKQRTGDITRIEDLYNLRLANEDRALTAPDIDANPNFQIDRFPSRSEAIRAVSEGQADVLLDTNLDRLLNLKKQTRSGLLDIATFSYKYERPVYLALSRNSVSLASAIELDEMIETMFADQTVHLIFRGYGITPPTYMKAFSRLRPPRKSTN